MGVIFRKEIPLATITNSIATNIQGSIHAALMEDVPATTTEASQRAGELAQPAAQAAAEIVAQRTGKIEIQTKPFLIALALFFVLLGIAIVLDWQNAVDDPKVYSGMVTTVLGAVIGFLGGDATGTASSA